MPQPPATVGLEGPARGCRQGDDRAGSAGLGLLSPTEATAFQVSRGEGARSQEGMWLDWMRRVRD